ncbi:hypothetical protein PN488_10790 [Nodularia spumigena CS-591/12]|uniref:hypothetical protein n=1 Tax=Nodularia spumigena TaxID=70799 RepID=UPI00232B88CE|nr:hypothetical protein [Nodularia spumigena]MDB9304859.1 hypothetical protein [Nodularia spumigena CS-591/12]MDB9342529.1 hypothetical protein [Nodularia spumigena CS-588/06]MDB9370127.1 hypothetical protein [Nodularia spumigena CS-586/05]
MYTYPNFRSILSCLSSLTLAELKLIQENIDAIITEKNIGNNQQNIKLHKYKSLIDSYLTTLVPSNVRSQENFTFLSNLYINREATDNLGLVLEQLKQARSLQLEQFKHSLNQKFSSDKKPDRPLGVWKGKVRMSDDFNESSSDILSEFGIEE